MKKLLPLIVTLLMIGCQGPKGDTGEKGDKGDNGKPGAGGGSDNSEVWQSIRDTYQDSILTIYCYSEGSWSRGTASLIKVDGRTMALTAQHVVKYSQSCELYTEEGLKAGTARTAVTPDSDRDLTYFRSVSITDGVSRKALEMSINADVDIGDELLSAHFPGKFVNDRQWVTAEVMDSDFGYWKDNEWSNAFAVHSVSWYGSSGSPFINKYGEVVGILVGAPGNGTGGGELDMIFGLRLNNNIE
jgi:hypothetical protein